MAVFREYKGLKIKYSHRDYKNALSYPERRLWGAENPEPINTKFCMPGAIQDLSRLPMFVKIG